MENSKNKPLVSFKLCPILSSVMKSRAIPLSPAWELNHPFAQRIPLISHLIAVSVMRWLWKYSSACVPVAFILIISPKRKSSDAGNSDMPKRSHKMLLLSEKLKVLHLIRKEKSCVLRLLRSTVRTNLLLVKLWRRKEIRASFGVTLQNTKVMASAWEVLGEDGKGMVCTIRYFERERERPHSHNFNYNIL